MSWLDKLLHPGSARVHVLAVMPETIDRSTLESIAARNEWQLRICGDCEDAVASLRRHPAAVVLCDRQQKLGDWREALRRLREEAPERPLIMVATEMDDHFWLEAMEKGAYDVVTRPFSESRVVSTVLRAAYQAAGSSL